MKKVLILAYYFPPLGMGGTQRAAKFAKYLPRLDWQPLVLTVKNVAYYARDPSLLDDVAGVKTWRTGSLDPQRLLFLLSLLLRQLKQLRKGTEAQPSATTSAKPAFSRIAKKILDFIFIPDNKVLWLPFALVRALQIIVRERPACLLTTGPPHSVHLLGVFLAGLTGRKLLVDFRDGWAGGNFQSETTAVHRALNSFLQKVVLHAADRVVTVSEPLTEALQAQLPGAAAKFVTITNGFDAEDLAQGTPKKREQFTIVYSGALSAISPVTSFLQALAKLLTEKPQLRGRLVVEFAGCDLEGEAAALTSEFNLNEIVHFSGYLPHLRALEIVLGADLLLYPVSEKASPDFIPGKTFEYAAAQRKVLAIGPAVAGMKILNSCTEVVHVRQHDPEVIAANLLSCVQAGKARQPASYALPEIYERARLTQKLAEVLNSCLPAPKL